MQPATNNPSPSKRRRWVWIAWGVAAVCCIAAALVYHFTRDTPLNRLKQQIRGEIPVGSTREQLETWAQQRLGQSLHENTAAADASGISFPEGAGVPRDDLGRTLDVQIMGVGWYTTPYGEAAHNNLWVFFTLDDAGQVTGHYFLTLEELAAIEQKRLKSPARN